MRFGFCTGFATKPLFTLDIPLVGRIRRAGYDFPDFPIMAFEKVTPGELAAVREAMGESVCPAACNLIPGHLGLVGDKVDPEAIRSYLRFVLPIMASFGVRHLVLGSAKSRMLPAGMALGEGKAQFRQILKTCLLPMARRFAMDILIEPLNRTECNLLNTLEESAVFVRETNEPDLLLMADLYHMEKNGEKAETLTDALPLIRHLHIAGKDRSLPSEGFDPYLSSCIRLIRESGYDGTVSFETVDGDIQKALHVLRSAFLSPAFAL